MYEVIFVRKVDITGQKFGKLTAIKKVGSDGHSSLWLCRCECGNEKIVTLPHLRQSTKSCGCLSKEVARLNGEKSKIGERSRVHGDFGKPLYGVWAAMKRRCNNPNSCYYKEYGGRGIRVCADWLEYIPFKEWSLNNGYQNGLSIDRIDSNGNYEPANCRWTTMKKQQNNRRNNIRLLYKGKSYTPLEITELTGLRPRTIRGRLERGWSIDEIIETPLLRGNGKYYTKK